LELGIDVIIIKTERGDFLMVVSKVDENLLAPIIGSYDKSLPVIYFEDLTTLVQKYEE